MKYYIQLLLIVNIFISNLLAQEISEVNKLRIENLNLQLHEINEELKDNIWITRYNNYLTYRKIKKELAKIEFDAKKYGRWKGEKYKELSYQLYNKIKIKENELELISEYKDSPIGKRIKPDVIQKVPDITNPLIIIEALSYIQTLKENISNYAEVNTELGNILDKILNKRDIAEEIYKLTGKKDKNLKALISKLKLEIKDFTMVVDIVSTTYEVYDRKIIQVIQEVHDAIAEEISRTIKLSIVILFFLVLAFGLKIALKKYIQDDDRQYTTNKLINFIAIIIIIFIILFSYIENASYLVTFLGFASAGIAIALKDWFMSLFGWMAIMTSGAINVGDRIKVTKDGVEVVGDVLDISLFKIALREDVTITTYMTNRRSGRVYFIPNNYIFTDMIANYTFDGLRTVWDGIDFYITFDSNHTKAVEIARGIVINHARGYTELTKKRLQKLRKKYVLRSANPEPRVFSFVEPYGVVISSWYYTNSHSTLALRSTISMEILEAFKKEDDITLAYPTQTLKISSNAQVDGVNQLKHRGLMDER